MGFLTTFVIGATVGGSLAWATNKSPTQERLPTEIWEKLEEIKHPSQDTSPKTDVEQTKASSIFAGKNDAVANSHQTTFSLDEAALSQSDTAKATLQAIVDDSSSSSSYTDVVELSTSVYGEDLTRKQSKDDLRKIKGIGTVFAKRLQEAGIHTFAELAARTPEQITEILASSTRRPGNVTTWIEQARKLASTA